MGGAVREGLLWVALDRDREVGSIQPGERKDLAVARGLEDRHLLPEGERLNRLRQRQAQVAELVGSHRATLARARRVRHACEGLV